MLLRPSLMDDEMDRGYLGRVKRLNGFRDKRETTDALRAWDVGLRGNVGRVATTELLCHCAAVSLETFSNSHMTLPWRRAITPFHPEIAHGSAEAASIHRISGFRLARGGAYLCPECIAGDHSSAGFSHWRREHQIPGRYLCGRHQMPLRRVENEWAFLEAPAAHLACSVPIAYALMEASCQNPVTKRFNAIGEALMARTAPLPLRSVMRALKRRARALDLQVDGSASRRPLLSDLILDACPTDWLKDVFPAARAKRRGMRHHQLDGVLYLSNAASSVQAYLLASAVLFESPDEAIGAFIAENASDPPPVRRRSKNAPAMKSLREAYVAAEGRYSAVAVRCETSLAIARARLERMGLPNLVRGRAQRDFRNAAVAFYRQGLPLAEAAAIGGVPCADLEALVREAGVALIDVLDLMRNEAALQAA